MFRNKVNLSIQEAKKVLGTARSPCIPTDQSHVYDDKYLLAEIGTRTTLLAVRNTLGRYHVFAATCGHNRTAIAVLDNLDAPHRTSVPLFHV